MKVIAAFSLASLVAADTCADGDLDCLDAEAFGMNTQLLQLKVELQPRKVELQPRKELTSVEANTSAEGTASSAETFHVGPFMASLAQQNVSREELEKVYKIVSNASLMQEANLRAAAGEGKCEQNTGGTCLFGSCDPGRGPTSCVTAACMCNAGYCASGGTCMFDAASAMGSALGMNSPDQNMYPGGTCMVGYCDR